MVAAPKRRTSPRLSGSKRKAPGPQKKETKFAAAAAAAVPAATGAGDPIIEAPAAKAPKLEQPTAASAAPTPAAGWLASFKAFIGHFTGSVAATLQMQAAKAKGRRAARQAARAKRRDAIKQRVMSLRQRK